MELGLSLSLTRTGRGGVSQYATYTTEGAKSVDNGWYEVYVQPNNGSDGWSTVKTVSGSITIAKAASQASLTRARVYGPYTLAPNTGDAVGAVLRAGFIYNSRGAMAWGYQAVPTGRMGSPTSSSPNLTPTHQGWIGNRASCYYTIHTNRIDKRARDANWTVLAQNTTPFAGIPGTPAVNHSGDGDYWPTRNQVVVPISYYATTVLFGNPHLVFYNADTLVKEDEWDVSAYVQGDAAGICIDDATGICYIVNYVTTGLIYRLDLVRRVALSPLSIPTDYDQAQGVALNPANGFLYVAAHRPSSGGEIVVIDRTGKVQWDQVLNVTTYGAEGVSFDAADGSFGYLENNAIGDDPSNVRFFNNLTTPTFTQAGFNSALAYGMRHPLLAPANEFDFVTRFTPATLYDFNSIWDAGLRSDGSAFEGWVNSAATINGRAKSTETASSAGAVVGQPIVYGFGFNQTTGARVLYTGLNGVVGANRVTTTVTPTAWVANTEFALGATASANLSSNNLTSYDYLFDRLLTEAEKQAIDADPFRIWTPTNALTAADKAQIQSS